MSVRIVCLSHAGGNASEFRCWQSLLLPPIEVHGITLPGRGARFSEPFLKSFDEVVDFAWKIIGAREDGCVLFGHSLGALIAFGLTNKLQKADRHPKSLIVSGCPSPDRHQSSGLAMLSDQGLKRWLDLSFDGELLAGEREELMDLLLPIVRADLRLYDSFDPSSAEPVSCPIFSISGRQDAEAQPGEMAGWSKYTRADCKQFLIEGDHFYTVHPTRTFIDVISAVLREAMA